MKVSHETGEGLFFPRGPSPLILRQNIVCCGKGGEGLRHYFRPSPKPRLCERVMSVWGKRLGARETKLRLCERVMSAWGKRLGVRETELRLCGRIVSD